MKEKTVGMVTALIVTMLLFGFAFGASKSVTTSSIGTLEVKPAWQVEWDKTLAAAKKEGKVVIYGPHYSSIRLVVTKQFKEDYPEIDLEYTPLPGSQSVAKLQAERRAGLKVVDLYLGGPSSAVTGIKEFGLPIEQFLILPEVKDGKYWLGGKLEFADMSRQFALVFISTLRPLIAYNKDLVTDREPIVSLWNIINDKWKEKIVLMDPIVPASGPGMSAANFIYNNPDLGPKYFKELAKLKPFLLRDERLMTEWIGRGKYPILVSPPSTEIVNLQKAGMPIQVVGTLNEGTYYSGGSGTLVYLSDIPHPNAAKVFLNWILGKHAQTAWSRTTEDVSRRLDVPMDHIPSWKVPKQGVKYWPDYKEEVTLKVPETLKFLKEIFSN